MPRYVVQGAPRQSGRAAALVPPIPTTPKASSYGLVSPYVTFTPGNRGVPQPGPAAIPPISAWGVTQPSHVAPNVRFPAIGNVGVAHMHPPVNLLRDNVMPIPARGYQLALPVAFGPAKTGGRVAMPLPRVYQAFAPAL